MAINTKDLLAKATAMRTEIQAAIDSGEHLVATAQGRLPVPQLVNAAGAAHALVTNLENHAAAVDHLLKRHGAPVVNAGTPEKPAK